MRQQWGTSFAVIIVLLGISDMAYGQSIGSPCRAPAPPRLQEQVHYFRDMEVTQQQLKDNFFPDGFHDWDSKPDMLENTKIGRASCRERV